MDPPSSFESKSGLLIFALLGHARVKYRELLRTSWQLALLVFNAAKHFSIDVSFPMGQTFMQWKIGYELIFCGQGVKTWKRRRLVAVGPRHMIQWPCQWLLFRLSESGPKIP